MRWRWLRRKQRPVSLKVVPLKKSIAVSDEYWEVLYQPLIDVTTRCFSVFGSSKDKLFIDYIDQFVKLVRCNKGTVQEDPLLMHIQTFSLSVAYTSLYLSRLMLAFECHCVSTDKSNKGERNVFYPWLHTPSNIDIRLKKITHVLPCYVYAFPIMSKLLCNDTGLKWLHSKPLIMKALYDALMSNGEKGLLSDLLSIMKKAPVDNECSVISITNIEPVHSTEQPKDTVENKASLNDLIAGLGGEDETPSIDQLLGDGVNNDNPNKKPNEKKTSPNPDDTLDFSVSVDTEKMEAVKKQDNLQDTTTDDALIEFQSYIQSQQLDDDVNFDVPVEELSLLTSSPLCDDLIKWCVSSLVDCVNGATAEGIHAVQYDGINRIGIDKDKAIWAFVKHDYTLDTKSDYQMVVDDVLTELVMSSYWIPNSEGGDEWQLALKGSTIEVLLLNVEFPSEVKLSALEIISL